MMENSRLKGVGDDLSVEVINAYSLNFVFVRVPFEIGLAISVSDRWY